MPASSESWSPHRQPHPWHLRATGRSRPQPQKRTSTNPDEEPKALGRNHCLPSADGCALISTASSVARLRCLCDWGTPMSDAQKETIIIVHGTWAAPDAGAVKWYQPSRDTATARQEFVAKLDLALEKRGSPARCWAHCQDTSRIYCWSGHNAWIERIHASRELASSVNRLQSENWRVHIIAHSHGGNVVVDALPALNGTAANPSGISGTVTTLGTPFMDVMSPIAKRLDRRHRIYEFV